MWTGEPPTVCGADAPISRRFVAEHDARVADLHLGVRDSAVGHRHAQEFLRAERLLVELHRRRPHCGRRGTA